MFCICAHFLLIQHLLPGEGVQQHDQQSRDVDRPGAGGGDYIFLALCFFCVCLCLLFPSLCDYLSASRRFTS